MDNLTHTLMGLSLAKAGLERATPLATLTLLVSSSLPDVDAVMRIGADTAFYLEHHRGITHSFIGVLPLAALWTLLLLLFDRRIRLRRDPFKRPIRPTRIFLLSYLAGVIHVYLDFTNTYGVRPLLPFDDRWVYGDLVVVIDPWIWLILGSAAVWLTARTPGRMLAWSVVGLLASLPVALAFREPGPMGLTIPIEVRLIWFVGLAVVAAGVVFNWGRAGPKLMRYAIIALTIYYGGMWLARQSALEIARESPPAGEVRSVAAWPTPANPAVWQAVVETDTAIHTRYVNLLNDTGEWRTVPTIPPRFDGALRRSQHARVFMEFTRYASATVEEQSDGYSVELRDLRFNLQMRANLSRDLDVQSADIRWF